MPGSVRRLAFGVLVALLAVSGFSYARTGAPNPVRAVIETVTAQVDPPETEVTPTPSPVVVVVADEPVEPDEGKERSTEGCPAGFTGNHGQFVSQTEERPRSEAAHSPCGKPVHAVEGKDEADDVGAEAKAKPDKPRPKDKPKDHGRGK